MYPRTQAAKWCRNGVVWCKGKEPEMQEKKQLDYRLNCIYNINMAGDCRWGFCEYKSRTEPMFNVPEFTKPQIDLLIKEGNLTERERTLLDLRNQEISLERCAEIMDMSVSTVSRTIRKMRSKAERLGVWNPAPAIENPA